MGAVEDTAHIANHVVGIITDDDNVFASAAAATTQESSGRERGQQGTVTRAVGSTLDEEVVLSPHITNRAPLHRTRLSTRPSGTCDESHEISGTAIVPFSGTGHPFGNQHDQLHGRLEAVPLIPPVPRLLKIGETRFSVDTTPLYRHSWPRRTTTPLHNTRQTNVVHPPSNFPS